MDTNSHFEEFAVKYTKYIKENLEGVKEALTVSKMDSLMDFISYKKCKDSNLSRLVLLSQYELLENKVLEYKSPDWFECIYNFAYFIRFAEKCFMYHNDETSNIYAENNKDKPKNITLYFKRDDYKAKISFEKTDIYTPGKSQSLLESFIRGDKDLNMYFINIEIVRSFGKQMCNTFKFVSGEDPKFNDISDELLLETFKNDISKDIITVYSKILDSIIPNYTGITTTYWKEVIEHGLWILR